jgi:hypothetical protein
MPVCISLHPHKAIKLIHSPGLQLNLQRRSLSPTNRYLPPPTSSYPPSTNTTTGNFPLLPLRTRTRGPAYTLPIDASLPAHLSPEPDSESYDALDEVLSLFRANTFFRNFEIQGPADRLLIYGILWVSECLGKVKPSFSARYVTLPANQFRLLSSIKARDWIDFGFG